MSWKLWLSVIAAAGYPGEQAERRRGGRAARLLGAVAETCGSPVGCVLSMGACVQHFVPASSSAYCRRQFLSFLLQIVSVLILSCWQLAEDKLVFH